MNGNDVQRNNTKYRNNHYYFEKQHKQILSVQGKHMIQSLYTCFCPFEYVANRRHNDEKRKQIIEEIQRWNNVDFHRNINTNMNSISPGTYTHYPTVKERTLITRYTSTSMRSDAEKKQSNRHVIVIPMSSLLMWTLVTIADVKKG